MKTKVTQNSPYTSRRTAEVTIWLFGILIILFVMLALNSSAYTPPNEEETYIDDIPFNTELVVSSIFATEFEDEVYIDDIPFDTKKVIEEMVNSNNTTSEFMLEEETYIDDIPFRTELVVLKYEYQLAINKTFEMPEEKYIEDIPFNTCLVAATIEKGKYSGDFACTNSL